LETTMAAKPDDAGAEEVEEPALESVPEKAGPLLSLLDLQLQRMPPGGTVSRLAYAAVLKSSGEEHEQFFASFPNRRDLTGICLVQDNTLFSILECHVEDMFPILRAVNKMKCIKSANIIANSEDCPSRLFPEWQHTAVSLEKESEVELDEEFVDSPTCGYDVYKRMLEFSESLSSAADIATSDKIALLPSAGRVEAYASTGMLSTLQEFLDDFDAPQAYRLESEVVWPMESTVPYLNSNRH